MARTPAASTKPRFAYRIAMPQPHRHLFAVTFEATGPLPGTVDVRMPVWSPGSYLVREYARHVQDLEVRDLDGRPLRFEKTAKETWRIDGAAAGFRFAFRLYAGELNVQSPHLDETHGFIHAPGVCPYVDGCLSSPCEITVDVEPGWRVATGLPAVRGKANTFRAGTYDVLADSPIECGPFVERRFDAGGRKHRIVISGGGEFDLDRLVKDTKKIVEVEQRFWGATPYRDYTFICHVYPGARGGLEHSNSTVLGIDSFGFKPPTKYVDDVLALIAHEFFHTWNVKRIRPASLGPFDYSKENYTKLLWVFEGITSYYDMLLVRRARLITPERYLKHVATNIGRLQKTPGRLRQSLADASFDTWIKFYRQHEHSPNTIISYYNKGELVALLLDLYLREKTNGETSLDDVMRELWRRFERDQKGIDEDGFERVAAEVSGLDLRRFFKRAVHSAVELDFDAAFRPFGLELVERPKGPRDENGDGHTPWIGIETESRGGIVGVKTVSEGSPADTAGIAAGDTLIAINGYRVTNETWKNRLRQFAAGRAVDVALFRRERLLTVSLVLDRKLETEFVVEPIEGAGARARRLRDAWLGDPMGKSAKTSRGSKGGSRS